MSCSKFTPTVDKLFVKGRLSGWRFRRLWRHLGGCESCRGYYDRVALTWQAMGPGAEPAQIAEARADAIVATIDKARSGGTRRIFVGLFAVAGALAALILIVRVVIPRRPGPSENGGEFFERGTAPARPHGLRAFCLAGVDGGVSVRAAASSARLGTPPANPLRCGLGDDLQLAYSLGAGEAEFLTVVALTDDQRRLPYEPSQNARSSTTLRAGVVDEPLAERIHLAENHHPGRVVIEALFTRHPLEGEALRAFIERGVLPDAKGEIVDREELPLVVEP